MNNIEIEQRFFDVAIKWKLVFAFGWLFWTVVINHTDHDKNK